jgi:NitT/TauT family transport system substrate-binding protein
MSLSKKLALLAALALVATACSGGTTASAGASLTPVKFQLKWVAQTQFAGYYAALDQNYYKDAGLDVSLLLGGPNINEVQIVATGGADMGTTWLPSMLQSREGGTDLVEIAQLYQRSGTRMASFKTANITTPNDMGGKRIGSWLGGNEPELFAALTKVGLDPTK